jgi:hypothetical protein
MPSSPAMQSLYCWRRGRERSPSWQFLLLAEGHFVSHVELSSTGGLWSVVRKAEAIPLLCRCVVVLGWN